MRAFNQQEREKKNQNFKKTKAINEKKIKHKLRIIIIIHQFFQINIK